VSESAEQLAVNVLVLGAGPGGYVAAIRAAQLGQTVAIVEREYWGGVCLNVGCIPTKVLLRHAEVASLVSRHAKAFGLPDGVTADYRAAHERSRSVAEGRIKGVHYLMKKNGIRQFAGTGTFTSDTSLTVTTADGCTNTYTYTQVVRPTEISIPNVFSPNGDGLNDVLEFPGVEYYANAQLSVFNRWGQEIYTNGNYKNTWNARDVSDGTYFFVLKVDGKEYTGAVTLLR
jgi:gliding motility-associated-like protein